MAGSGRCATRFILFATVCSLVASPAAAQWHADVQAGRLQYDAAPEAVTTSIAGGVSYSTPVSALAASVGVPFSRAEPMWAALQGFRRVTSSGAIAFGVDLGADAFGYHLSVPDTSVLPVLFGEETPSITGWGAAAEVMPLVTWSGARVGLEARAGVVSFISDGNHVDYLQRTSFVADATARAAAWRALSLRAEGRWVSAPEGGFPFAGIALAWDGTFAVWGALGRWLDDAAQAPSWRAGAAVPLGDRVALVLNAEHEEIDPVYATPARTTWGAGLRVLLGAPAAGVREPVPDAYADGIATIRLDVDEAGSGTPSIAGDFNEWTPAPMTLDPATGAWQFRTPLQPGVYHFAFVDEAGNWFVPEGTPGRRSDGMGGHVAVLVVEEG